MKIFTCKNFSGHWPVGTAAVVVASDMAEAKRMLLDALAAAGLPQSSRDIADLRMTEVAASAPSVTILNDGNY